MSGNTELQIEKIDTAAGIKRFGGKAEIYKKSLLKFANQYIEITEPSDKDELKSLAHQIKGVSANLGMDELSALAAETERALEDKTGFFNALRELCGNIISKIQPASNEPFKSKTGSSSEFNKLIAELRGFMQMCNPKQSEEIIEKLSATNWVNVAPFDFKPVKAAIDSYDFDTALMLIKDL